MNEAEATMFVDSVENMHEKQQGLLPDGKLHIQPKAREAFVSMYSQLRRTHYDDDACMAVLHLLNIEVDKESLMKQLPALSKAIISTTDSVKLSTTESSAVQAKLQAIRDTVLPSAEEIKQQLKKHVSDNGRSARQGFGAELHVALQSVIASIPNHAGLKPRNVPVVEKWPYLTSTGFIASILGMNPLGSASMAFSSPSKYQPGGTKSFTSEMSGSRSEPEESVASLKESVASLHEDTTGFETLVATMQGKSSKEQSIERVCSLTGNLNGSLYFTEKFPHKIQLELLKTASFALLSAIRNRLMVPTKFIESMVILNELVLFVLENFQR